MLLMRSSTLAKKNAKVELWRQDKKRSFLSFKLDVEGLFF